MFFEQYFFLLKMVQVITKIIVDLVIFETINTHKKLNNNLRVLNIRLIDTLFKLEKMLLLAFSNMNLSCFNQIKEFHQTY